MAFQYGEQRDSSGNITHEGSWGTKSVPKEAIEQIVENFRAIKEDSIVSPGTHSHIMNVKVATTQNISLTDLLVIDGVQTSVGNLVLVKDQTNKVQNGVYIVANGKWTRTPTLPLINIVQDGTENKGTIYFLTTQDPIVDTSEITYFNMFGWALGENGFTITNNKVELSATGVTPGTYRSVTVDSKGRISAGTNPSTVQESGIVDAETVSGSQTKANQAEANAKAYADTKKTEANTYTDTKVADLVGSSPETLNTLNELAQALGDDPNFATTVTNKVATKLPKDGSEAMTGDLTLANLSPTNDLHAAAKGYVDQKALMMAIIFGG